MKLIVHVDGGARGNPGPAAAACVITAPGGELVSRKATWGLASRLTRMFSRT